jgi:hypothetical protein
LQASFGQMSLFVAGADDDCTVSSPSKAFVDPQGVRSLE